MGILIVYSSRTGNTEQVARAIAEAIPGSRVYSVGAAPRPGQGDIVFVGFWVYRGKPDEATAGWLQGLAGCQIALFGTLAAWPDSEHAARCRARAEALVLEPERGNTVLGSFLCQGRMSGTPRHPMTPERRARLDEAAKRPNEADFARARAFALDALARRPAPHPA